MSKYVRDKAHCRHTVDSTFVSQAQHEADMNAVYNYFVKPENTCLKEDFVEVTGTITIPSGNTSRGTNISLPNGFTFENTRVIDKWYASTTSNMRYTDNNITFYVNGLSATPAIGATLTLNEAPTTDTTYNVGFILMKKY